MFVNTTGFLVDGEVCFSGDKKCKKEGKRDRLSAKY
jgi:hypothetical protein